MWNTVNTKSEHYTKGSFSVGSGPEVVVILGSCRVVPYLQYFEYLNADNRFTIHLINVVNFYYDQSDKQVDPNEFTKQFETNAVLLDTLKRCKWFIHEHTENFGMFNTANDAPKNIYQFGMAPEKDISIPNWNNTFVLFQEYVLFDRDIRNQVIDDLKNGDLRAETKLMMKEKGNAAIVKFLEICAKTDVPEMVAIFTLNWRSTRFFWTGNHITNHFTTSVFRVINNNFFHIPIPDGFWERVQSEDLYAEPHTQVTKWDVEMYELTWPQPVANGFQLP